MIIKKIEIKNVKGIKHIQLVLDLGPNKPNLFVAPNGYGKSSIACSFNSLNKNRISLHKDCYHENSEDNHPEMKITIESDGEVQDLIANKDSNTINKIFDVFVINSKLEAKAISRKISGTSITSTYLGISPIVMIPTIPVKQTLSYKKKEQKENFGKNGKILPDLKEIVVNPLFLSEFLGYNLTKLNGTRFKTSLNECINKINNLEGTVDSIKKQIDKDLNEYFEHITILEELKLKMKNIEFCCFEYSCDIYLALIQIIEIYIQDKVCFKKYCERFFYNIEKQRINSLLDSFNTSWLKIKLKEVKNKGLLIEFPKSHNISNGQRDILSFIALLVKAEIKLKKKNIILIIDEVFDYLDDANLTSAQYYITKSIEHYKTRGINFFPVIMTHLDPNYFKHFCFNRHKLKIHYLAKSNKSVNPHLKKLIRHRNNETIKEIVDKYYFHFHPENIDCKEAFKTLSIRESWGDQSKFQEYIYTEFDKYSKNEEDYDPIAICFAVRYKIESTLFSQISNDNHKANFIAEHGTKKKLNMIHDLGIEIPEIYFLLGLIYNDGLHWHNNRDNISPIVHKLENFTIKHLIKSLKTL